MSDRLQEIKERCEKATLGPWRRVLGHESEMDACVHFEGDDSNDTVCFTQCYDSKHYREDMDFIAHARSDVPYLLGEIEKLKAELDIYKPLGSHLAECDNLLTSYALPKNVSPARRIIILAEAFSLLLAQSARGRQYYFELAQKTESEAHKLYTAIKDEAGIND